MLPLFLFLALTIAYHGFGFLNTSYGGAKNVQDHKPHTYSLPVGERLNLRSLIFILFGFVGIDISDLQSLQLYLDLSWNALGGSLPEEIGKITMVTCIDISGNKFHGAIPTVVGSCVGLKHLNLSRNALEGLIPEAMENLKYIIALELSSNFLTSPLPKLLKKLQVLCYVNLSFNRFMGEILKEGVFTNATAIVLLNGNAGLCGPRKLLLPECPSQKSASHFKTEIVVVASVSDFVICCLLLVFLWLWSLHEKNEAFELVDRRIAKGESEINKEEVVRVIHIAHLCTQSALEMRPSMSNVVSMLTSSTKILVQRTPSPFIDVGSNLDSINIGWMDSSMVASTEPPLSVSLEAR
ncbi:hypothetical protein KI387_028002 [Taxus chinensis]|uniref:Uncharacterized protein n=1 Tax=Taxus chinensis TaxID=29808 RepID=A0AA38LA06_TAXCH|nr:hypothetical protein KI387_028002 [Taxus chinensis]